MTETERKLDLLLGDAPLPAWKDWQDACQRQRDVIVGFPAHGNRHRRIDIRLATV